ncbi:flavodoxin domain-containing protein [Dethiobacter alkaliphilus]|uniref:Flavodoxin-like domain-containing protein n=1 Tax=Dethiobacter alkaliphilus AHT 1 TaxID=555088 RepID=C0GDE0_DETAL|nr:flavodoxin domain-containing protein [Dethiobacter alkaliphilus]EEG78661.1 conserved hypothetical protein [Dethiobacter alkaliphilus AHT 1]
MKTLIVYGSKHGCTEKCVGILKEKMSGEAVAVNLEKEQSPDLEGFSAVVIGSPVYAGQIKKPVAAFIQSQLDALQQKRVGLFLVGGNLEQMETQMNTAFPESLRKHALATEHFGYAYDFKKLNFFERKIIQVIGKVNNNQENIETGNIEKMADAIR